MAVLGGGVCCGCGGSCLPRGCLPGGCLPGGCLPRGRCLPERVCVSQHAMGQTPHRPLWTEFLTHACENITFPQLLLRTVMIKKVGIRILRSQFVKNNLRYRASRTYHPVCCRCRRVELGSPGEKLRPRPEPASPETKHVRLRSCLKLSN